MEVDDPGVDRQPQVPIPVESPQLPHNLAFTKNCSYTFSSTESACLDFYAKVMQNTDEDFILEKLETSWEEDSLLTLKLVFQLRDIRRGKGSIIEFHHCLGWILKKHPLTLIYNVQFIAQHGYWKDLSWLIKFLLEDKVSMKTDERQKKKKRRFKKDSPEKEDYSNLPLEEFIRKRVEGEVSKDVWRQYLMNLEDEDRKEAKLKFQTMAKVIHLEHHQQARNRKKFAQVEVVTRLSNMREMDPNFAALYDEVVQVFTTALQRDKEALEKDGRLESTALAGKWAPSIGGGIDASTLLGKNIARALYSLSHQRAGAEESVEDFDVKAFNSYRKNYLTPLRRCISVPETFMSKRKWSEIDYQRVPSVCMKRSRKIFQKRDQERFNHYLEEVKAGKKKIASGALMPHEIVEEFMNMSFKEQSPEAEKVAELQWASYVENLKKSGTFESALAVCDVSGSMYGTPMVVAIALSLLTAAVSKPPFNNVIISFSKKPSLHRIDQPSLKEKISFTRHMDWGMSTNMQAVFDLILKLALDTKLPPGEMVKTIFIFSDMEFDKCGGKKYETDYQFIKRKFEEAGYQLPGIVFWNLKGGGRSNPVTKDEKNVALVSGFSGQMMKSFLENGSFITPFQTMLDTLGKNYDHLKICD